MKSPNLISMYGIHNLLDCTAEINGKWVPCRPLNFFILNRFKLAWMVFTGKADALVWPEGQ